MKVSVLIPTFNRLTALVATLTALTTQDFKDFEVVIADQSDVFIGNDGVIQTLQRIFNLHQTPFKLLQNLPKKGIAQQRQLCPPASSLSQGQVKSPDPAPADVLNEHSTQNQPSDATDGDRDRLQAQPEGPSMQARHVGQNDDL